MERPTDDIAGMLAAHRRLEAALEGLDDATARRPSLLPDWTVGHVLTHVARNADSVTVRIEGALAGEVRDQYPGGAAGRKADIEAGAGRSAAELVDDVREANARLEAAIAGLPDDAWGRLSRNLGGEEQAVALLPFARWREVEVHHVDLGLGYSPDQWPEALADRWLPALLPALPGRSDPRALLAWALRRGPAPELGPW
jgi:maleylpyruvate isomerase